MYSTLIEFMMCFVPIWSSVGMNDKELMALVNGFGGQRLESKINMDQFTFFPSPSL